MQTQFKQRGMPSQQRLAVLRLQLMAAESKERVGSRIRQARKAKDWTQRDLAREIAGSVEGADVGRWERGQVMPRPETLDAIAKALDVDVSYFYAPEPAEGTADLMGALNKNGAAPERLDRLEALLLQVLERLDSIEDEMAGREIDATTREIELGDTPDDSRRGAGERDADARGEAGSGS